MAFASIGDINLHLPNDKLIVDDGQYPDLELDAERIVRGYLVGSYSPTTLAGWTSPETTPGLIRGITGRLVAAFYYRKRYSEDSLRDPEYAQVKYNEAMKLLNDITAGILELDIADPDVTGDLIQSDFWPNNNTTPAKFSMDMPL